MMRGCVCRWCGEAVTEADERYEAMDGTAVHAECMEALLLETVGVGTALEKAALAEQAARCGGDGCRTERRALSRYGARFTGRTAAGAFTARESRTRAFCG